MWPFTRTPPGPSPLDGLQTALAQLPEAVAEAVAQRAPMRETPPADAAVQALQDRLESCEAKIHELTHAVDEGIARTDRAERRIRAVVKRARDELAEGGFSDPGLEAEAADLRLIDGGGRDERGVQPMRENVADDSETSSVRGVPLSVLRRARGIY